MRRMLVPAAVIIATSAFTWAQAPTHNHNASSAQGGQVQQELIALDKQWSEAGQRGDRAALERILADGVISVGAQGQTLNKAENIADTLATAGGASIGSFMADAYDVRVYGDTAVMTHRTTVTGQRNGQPFSEQRRSLHVWMKRDGRWQVIASQAAPIAGQPTSEATTAQPTTQSGTEPQTKP